MIPENSTQKVEEAAHAYAADSKFVLVENAIADADMLQKAGKIDEAVEKWRAIAIIVEGADDNLAADAWVNAGHLLAARNDGKTALSAYDNAIRLNSAHAEAYLHRGKVKNALELYEAALTDLNEALQLQLDCKVGAISQSRAETHTARGVAKFGLGEHKTAFVEHATALRLNPNCAEAYYNQGIAKMKLGEYEAVITEFDAALRINPDMAEVYHYRGYVKFLLGQSEAAIADYDQAIRLAPWHPVIYTNRGFVKDMIGQREAALADYEEAIRVDPEFAHPYSHRAKDKIRHGRDEEAIADLKTALRLAHAAGDKQHQAYVESWLEELYKSRENSN